MIFRCLWTLGDARLCISVEEQCVFSRLLAPFAHGALVFWFETGGTRGDALQSHRIPERGTMVQVCTALANVFAVVCLRTLSDALTACRIEIFGTPAASVIGRTLVGPPVR